MTTATLSGKLMNAKYAGKCADCGTRFAAGTEIRYDGSAHCSDNCEAALAPIRAERKAERRAQLAQQQAYAAMTPVEKARHAVQIAEQRFVELDEAYSKPCSPLQLRMRSSHYESATMRLNEAKAALANLERNVAAAGDVFKRATETGSW